MHTIHFISIGCINLYFWWTHQFSFFQCSFVQRPLDAYDPSKIVSVYSLTAHSHSVCSCSICRYFYFYSSSHKIPITSSRLSTFDSLRIHQAKLMLSVWWCAFCSDLNNFLPILHIYIMHNQKYINFSFFWILYCAQITCSVYIYIYICSTIKIISISNRSITVSASNKTFNAQPRYIYWHTYAFVLLLHICLI